MTSSPIRCATLAALFLLMLGCQSRQQAEPAPAAVAVAPSAQERFDASLANGELGEAEAQLEALRSSDGEASQLLHAQRRLAEAYLQEGQKALETGDLDKAATSLGHARTLMPKAPALTTGLDGAIGKAREAELSAVEQARQAGEQAQAARREQLRLLRQAAEAQAAATRNRDDDDAAVTASVPRARLIDPAAASSTISLPMLDTRDEAALFEQLDNAAADVVAFDCAVHIEVRSAQDLRRVTALLEARIAQRDPSFAARLSHALRPVQVPRLVLSPRGH
ncbi:hypothetical protein [Phytopseudomonas dryadis]|uniref:Lipoprotein n=1 Tax=Phytopseudomonas dryadis TaxID=2487520 RepID=A0A4Q9R0P6_9GAMM|nr:MULTISPECIES: hypothetical protein [Pseudomonas]TBU92513.1 hypothetical protein DNK44_12175 [Pseudomonas dryadis]TBV03073.1 hypothetical protein DNK34_17640 [Pseudomonas dryadis]TBV17650.1 hypothetical protein DNK41_12195 [Pseudomonas sp. FRB 230]